MLQQQWRQECAEFLGQTAPVETATVARLRADAKGRALPWTADELLKLK